MDGRAHPPDYVPHTHMGFSTGEWHGDILTVTTTHIKKEFYRRSGIPSSDSTTLVEHYIRHGNLLSHVMIITDPVYLTEPYVNSEEFVLMERGNQNWLYNCEYVMEVPMDKNDVPYYLPGRIRSSRTMRRNSACRSRPCSAARRRRTPSTMPKLEQLMKADERRKAAVLSSRARSGARRPAATPRARFAANAVTDRRTYHVQGNVHMLVGAGANVAVQIGDEGVLVVDTGGAASREACSPRFDRFSDRPDPLDRQHERGARPHGRQRDDLAGRPDRERESRRDHRARERARAHDGGQPAR